MAARFMIGEVTFSDPHLYACAVDNPQSYSLLAGAITQRAMM
jgi:hypothetical protein